MSEPVSPVSHRVVIDTNVWISAALSKQSAPARLLQRVLSDGLPVFSSATFAELESRLWKPKFDRYLSLEARRLILHDANAASHWVSFPGETAMQRYSRDADDDKFIHTALVAAATWLVTGDQDLLTVADIPGLSILTPAQALACTDFLA